MSAGTSRTRTVPSPKSSQAKPNRSSSGRFSSSSAPSSRDSSAAMGVSRVWRMGGSREAFSRSKLIRSWAACLSISHTFPAPSSQMM